MGYTQKVVLIGAGISGLACAFRLKQLRVPCLILEADSRAGGVIATTRRNGYLFELGPQCPRFPASVWHLVRELGLDREFLAGDPKAKRYIFRAGRLHPAPFSPVGLFATGLLGASSKFRILTEVLRTTRPPRHEESLAEFVERKFGIETLESLVDPLVSTVFFGDACKMGMQSAFPALVEWERDHGSLVRGALRARASKRDARRAGVATAAERPATNPAFMKVTDALPSLGSFRGGMARLPEKLADQLQQEIRYAVQVESATPLPSEDANSQTLWQIRTSNGEKILAEHLVLCVPAYEAAKVLEQSVPAVAAPLRSIEYAPIEGVSSAYNRSQVQNPLDGFGFMVPRTEGLGTICTFWNSSLFRERAPQGKVLITSFVRCNANQGPHESDDEAFSRAIEAENAAILGTTGQPQERTVWTHPRALPQYNVGHPRIVAAIRDALRALPNLHLASNYLQGRSIGDCVDLAFEVAENVHSRLPPNCIEPLSPHSTE